MDGAGRETEREPSDRNVSSSTRRGATRLSLGRGLCGARVAFVVCLLMTTAIYAPSLANGYLYEDLTATNRTWSGWVDAGQAAVAAPARSLSRLSVDLTRHVFGPSARPLRIVSLGWHVLNGWLLWLVARPLLSAWGATLAAGVFLLHPMQTESVAYLASQPELMAATWILLALLASARGWMVLTGICAALAITGKDMAIVVWLLVPLWAWQTDQRWSRAQIAGWIVAAAGMVAAFDLALAEHGWLVAPSVVYVAGQLTQAGRLVLLIPEALIHPHALTIDHDWAWITRTTAYAGAGGWLMALVLTRGWWRFALLWTAVALLPRLVLPLPDGIHERHLTTPLIAWSLAVGSLLKES